MEQNWDKLTLKSNVSQHVAYITKLFFECIRQTNVTGIEIEKDNITGEKIWIIFTLCHVELNIYPAYLLKWWNFYY